MSTSEKIAFLRTNLMMIWLRKVLVQLSTNYDPNDFNTSIKLDINNLSTSAMQDASDFSTSAMQYGSDLSTSINPLCPNRTNSPCIAKISILK